MDTLCSDLQQLFIKQLKASELCLHHLDEGVNHQLYLSINPDIIYYFKESLFDQKLNYYDRFKEASKNNCVPWILEILSITNNDEALCYAIECRLEWLFDRYTPGIADLTKIASCYLKYGYYDRYKKYERNFFLYEDAYLYSQCIAAELGSMGKDFFTKVDNSFFVDRSFFASDNAFHCYGLYVKGLASGKHLELLRKEIPNIDEYCDYIDMIYILVELKDCQLQLKIAAELDLAGQYTHEDFKTVANDLADPNDLNCPELLEYLTWLHNIQ